MNDNVNAQQPARGGNVRLLVLSWLWVGLPLAYGVYQLVSKASKLFVQ